MGDPNIDIFKFMAQAFSIDVFIETGSGLGVTAAKAEHIFPVVYTVELSEDLHRRTKKRVGEGVNCYQGDSVSFLAEVLPGIDDSILYWLDAHWTYDKNNNQIADKHNQCPVIGELLEINKRPGNKDYILIDDAHVFFSPAVLKPPHISDQWPGIMQIFEVLNEKDRYTVIISSWRCAKHGVLGGIVFPEDVIISVPAYVKDKWCEWLHGLDLEGVSRVI